jgi:hypothetical protein
MDRAGDIILMSWKFNPLTGKLDYYESASSFNTVTTLADFGSGSDDITISSIPATWATSSLHYWTSVYGTPDNDDDEAIENNIRAIVTNIINGVGFDLIVKSDDLVSGRFTVITTGG